MTDQLKAVLNRCIFSSALKLVRDEADCTAIKSKPFGSDAFADLFTDSIGVHDNDLLNPRIAWATRMPVPVHMVRQLERTAIASFKVSWAGIRLFSLTV